MTATAYGHRGFTLIELMIVVAIIGLLAALAVPSFIAYRNKSRIASGLASAGSIRNALGGYASVAPTNCFPMTAAITSWAELRAICNFHGANLLPTPNEQGFSLLNYHGVNSDGILDDCDNAVPGKECAGFCIILQVSSAPQDLTGVQIEVRADGIFRQTYSNGP